MPKAKAAPKVCMAYITTKDKAQALAIGRTLIEKKLAACANILPQMESIYPWEGKIETAQEAVLVVKTREAHKEKLVLVVKALHSYDCPCVVFYDIHGGNPDYLHWIAENT